MKQVLISKSTIQACLVAMSRDADRVALMGLGILEDGSVAATDGHVLIYLEHPSTVSMEDYPESTDPLEELTLPLIVPADALKMALKSIGKNKGLQDMTDTLSVEKAHGAYRIRNGLEKSTFTFTPIDREYPNVRRLLPKGTIGTAFRVGLSVEVLENLCKMAKAFSSRKAGETGLFFAFDSSEKMFSVRLLDCDSEYSIVGMPFRIPDGVYDW